jgi:outer membrane protein assembly factor BamE
MKSIMTRILIISLSLYLSSCSLIYKIDVQQGNIVTTEMLNKLRKGMSTEKIKFIMGTPLMQDIFHKNRLDYFYSLKSGTGEHEQKRIFLYLKNDKLIRIDGETNIELQTEDLTDEIIEPIL